MITQRQRLRELFTKNPNVWIGLPQILDMKIAQYNSRLSELRDDGMFIQNRIKTVNGQRHSWFIFNPDGQSTFIYDQERSLQSIPLISKFYSQPSKNPPTLLKEGKSVSSRAWQIVSGMEDMQVRHRLDSCRIYMRGLRGMGIIRTENIFKCA